MSEAAQLASGELAQFAERAATAQAPDGSSFFIPGEPIIAARAPGRLDVMGGIADYSGSLVLELPAREATLVAMQAAGEGLRVISRSHEGNDSRQWSLSSDEFQSLAALDYAAARKRLTRNSEAAWAAYVVGVLLVLARETKLELPPGLRVLVESTVPEGKGLSSSAAIEVATARAACELAGLKITGEELARLCQLAENHVVGAPCGIMDQMTSAIGRDGELMGLLCQPATVEGYARLPESLGVWGIDSGIRHAVSGADYGSVRTGAFMGYRILCDLAGLPFEQAGEGRVTIRDDRWGGYLANVSPDQFEREFAPHVPELIAGAEFLARYGGITDAVTRVDPAREYAVLAPTRHPIGEHARVREFARLLEATPSEADCCRLGELMVESHASYSACGVGSGGTDAIVELCRQAGPEQGIYGAKITGGGSGGTVAVLARADAAAVVERIAHEYAATSDHLAGQAARVFSGSSPGAIHLAPLRLAT